MSQESRINDALKQLGEEYRLGMVNAEEFRGRRRALLESWGERDVTTSPSAMSRKSGGTTQVNQNLRNGDVAASSPATGKSGKDWLAGGLVVLLATGVGAYFVAKKRPPAPGASATVAAPVVKRSPELLAVMRAAQEFLSHNRWETEDTDAFLIQWRSLTAQDRQLANSEPSLQSLRHELNQNIQAESQAMGSEASAAPSASAGDNSSFSRTPAPVQQERLDRLRAFAQELEGGGT